MTSPAYMPTSMIIGLKLMDPELKAVGRQYAHATQAHDAFHLLEAMSLRPGPPEIHSVLEADEDRLFECLRRRLVGYLN